MKQTIDRVLNRVERIPFSGCWLFTGAVNHFGYGIVGLENTKKVDRTHRVTYRHFKGEIPKGMFVCHTCDVPSCCNPDHLFIGTNHDNVLDMIRKRRNSLPPRNPHVVGSLHPLAKLHERQIPEIKELYAKGWSQQKLAEKFGVVRQTISKIVNKKRFKHV